MLQSANTYQEPEKQDINNHIQVTGALLPGFLCGELRVQGIRQLPEIQDTLLHSGEWSDLVV